jgi:hypothetical protein
VQIIDDVIYIVPAESQMKQALISYAQLRGEVSGRASPIPVLRRELRSGLESVGRLFRKRENCTKAC